MFGVSDPAVEAAVRAYVKLMRASRAVQARIEPLLAGAGLTVTQLGVLEAVLHKGPQTQRARGRLVLTSAGNMTDVIDKLESRGLVVRVAVPGDRRSLHVALPAEGRALIEGVFPRHAADIAAAMAGVAPGEFDRLGDLLRAIGRAAEAKPAG